MLFKMTSVLAKRLQHLRLHSEGIVHSKYAPDKILFQGTRTKSLYIYKYYVPRFCTYIRDIFFSGINLDDIHYIVISIGDIKVNISQKKLMYYNKFEYVSEEMRTNIIPFILTENGFLPLGKTWENMFIDLYLYEKKTKNTSLIIIEEFNKEDSEFIDTVDSKRIKLEKIAEPIESEVNNIFVLVEELAVRPIVLQSFEKYFEEFRKYPIKYIPLTFHPDREKSPTRYYIDNNSCTHIESFMICQRDLDREYNHPCIIKTTIGPIQVSEIFTNKNKFSPMADKSMLPLASLEHMCANVVWQSINGDCESPFIYALTYDIPKDLELGFKNFCKSNSGVFSMIDDNKLKTIKFAQGCAGLVNI